MVRGVSLEEVHSMDDSPLFFNSRFKSDNSQMRNNIPDSHPKYSNRYSTTSPNFDNDIGA